MKQLWECEDCGRLEFSDPTAGDDWGGEESAVGPTCPKCEFEMNPMDTDKAVLIEEFIDDTTKLTQSIVQWGDRWSKIGDDIEKFVTESQKSDIANVIAAFTTAVQGLGAT